MSQDDLVKGRRSENPPDEPRAGLGGRTPGSSAQIDEISDSMSLPSARPAVASSRKVTEAVSFTVTSPASGIREAAGPSTVHKGGVTFDGGGACGLPATSATTLPISARTTID